MPAEEPGRKDEGDTRPDDGPDGGKSTLDDCGFRCDSVVRLVRAKTKLTVNEVPGGSRLGWLMRAQHLG